MTTTTNTDEVKRIETCLAYIAANPVAKTLLEINWYREVEAEARQAGLLPARSGCNCPVNPYPAVYGGDMVEAF